MRFGIVVVLFLGFVLAGCATSREVVDVRVSNSAISSTAVPVKIVAVNDRRVFQLAPRNPSVPSLKNGEINNLKITKRAIARKRSGFGMALGDVLLPEGRTVEQLAGEALAKALNESGYKVLSKGDAGYETARPLTAEIDQFWAWMTSGVGVVTLEFRTKVRLVGDWPVDIGRRSVSGDAQVIGLAATTGLWSQLVNNGLAKLIDAVKAVLRKSSAQLGSPGAKPVC